MYPLHKKDSVLCGSKKYPSRDPFAHLLKGSLQTFLNAMTYPDRTVYPCLVIEEQRRYIGSSAHSLLIISTPHLLQRNMQHTARNNMQVASRNKADFRNLMD
eukprot:scaffold11816_cov145-Alexandrium_tamarense.AAC.1